MDQLNEIEWNGKSVILIRFCVVVNLAFLLPGEHLIHNVFFFIQICWDFEFIVLNIEISRFRWKKLSNGELSFCDPFSKRSGFQNFEILSKWISNHEPKGHSANPYVCYALNHIVPLKIWNLSIQIRNILYEIKCQTSINVVFWVIKSCSSQKDFDYYFTRWDWLLACEWKGTNGKLSRFLQFVSTMCINWKEQKIGDAHVYDDAT